MSAYVSENLVRDLVIGKIWGFVVFKSDDGRLQFKTVPMEDVYGGEE